MSSEIERLCVVQTIQDGKVTVRCGPQAAPDRLKALGARKSWLQSGWTFKYSSDEELGRILVGLRDSGDVAFVGTPAGWPPAAVFEYLREKKLASGPYTEITWRGPGDPILIEHSAED